MKTYRRPILILAAVVAAVLLIVGGLSALRGVIWKYNAPVEPVATQTGIYWVSAVKEPELAHSWQSEHHTLYREDEVWIALDGDRAYRLDPEAKRLRRLAEGVRQYGAGRGTRDHGRAAEPRGVWRFVCGYRAGGLHAGLLLLLSRPPLRLGAVRFAVSS